MIQSRLFKSRPLRGLWAGAVAVAVAGAVAACGSSSASKSASSGPSASTTANAAASAPPYNGPEAKLPSSYPAPTVKKGYSFTLGWLQPTDADPYVHSVAMAGKARTQALGGKFIQMNANLNVQTQVSQCNQLIARGVTAMEVYGVDANALTPCLKQAAAKGIKIVGEDTPPIPGQPLLPGYQSAVEQGQDRAHYLLAKSAASQHPGASFATIGTVLPVTLLQWGVQRSKYWGEKFGLKYLGDVDSQQDTPTGGQAAMRAILTKYPDVKIVFAYNDPAAEGAAAAARAENKDVAVYGNSGDPAAIQMIAAGQLTGTVAVEPKAVGTQLVNGLYDELTKQHLPLPKQIALGSMVVTKANASKL